MFFRVCFFFFFLVHFVTSNSDQEDLSIPTYYHIRCLTLNPDKQFITNGLQENYRLPYQTFSSPNLTIELCFRLCRRWTILTNNDHTTCTCLYTIIELYDMNRYLGEVLPTTNCPTNALQIYSLTGNPYILPLPTPTDDWSFEGCYRLDDLKDKDVNITFTDKNYTSALNACRNHCEPKRTSNYFPFYLSLKKSCYCLPVKIVPLSDATQIRKPLVHCSFLSYLKKGFHHPFNESLVHNDTIAQILVRHFCLPSFTFDRDFYRCYRTILLGESNSYSDIILNHSCSPMTVTTSEQYNHLLSLLNSSHLRTFIGINRNSTYFSNELLKSKNLSATLDLCLVINRIDTLTYNLAPCSKAQSFDYVFCTQKPIETDDDDQSAFKSIQSTPIFNNITCPTGFILFDNRCYYVDTSFVNNTEDGQRVCSDKYENSSLIKLDSDRWNDYHSVEYRGRAIDDILLEFFYYHLEQKLNIESKNSKNWLRLLTRDKDHENTCVLQYFTRSTGGFTVSARCNDGGNPVCQSEPILIPEIASKMNFLLFLTIIIVSLVSLVIISGAAFTVYCLRRKRGLASPRDVSGRFTLERRQLPVPTTTNETCNAPDAVYDELLLETCPESIEMDVYITNPTENIYITIDDANNLRGRNAEKNNKQEDSYYAALTPNEK